MKFVILLIQFTISGTVPGSVFGFGHGVFKFDPNGGFQAGKSTHYGPFPGLPAFSEIGYLKNDVGVGCSTGAGDPRWQEILKNGTMINPLDPNTVWPVTPTVAVSQAAWAKEDVCFKKITIRNKNRPEFSVEAHIVDFCPSTGCLWDTKTRHLNADIYGQETWTKLGAQLTDGVMEIEIKWPNGIKPYSNNGYASKYSKLLVIISLITIFFL